jgi:hypothetical protein
MWITTHSGKETASIWLQQQCCNTSQCNLGEYPAKELFNRVCRGTASSYWSGSIPASFFTSLCVIAGSLHEAYEQLGSKISCSAIFALVNL